MRELGMGLARPRSSERAVECLNLKQEGGRGACRPRADHDPVVRLPRYRQIFS